MNAAGGTCALRSAPLISLSSLRPIPLSTTMKRIALLLLAVTLSLAALPGGNGSGTGQTDPDRDVLDLV